MCHERFSCQVGAVSSGNSPSLQRPADTKSRLYPKTVGIREGISSVLKGIITTVKDKAVDDIGVLK